MRSLQARDRSQEQLTLFDALPETHPDGKQSRSLEVYDALAKFLLVRDRESTDENLREWNNVTIGQHTVRMTMAAGFGTHQFRSKYQLRLYGGDYPHIANPALPQ